MITLEQITEKKKLLTLANEEYKQFMTNNSTPIECDYHSGFLNVEQTCSEFKLTMENMNEYRQLQAQRKQAENEYISLVAAYNKQA